MGARLLIHACNDRLWYVNEYLIPSMTEQGIKREQIEVYVDTDGEGNLASWLATCQLLKDRPGGTWHLQDDVLIARDFARQIEEHNKGIVCGFCHDLYETEGVRNLGYVFPFLAWQSSFPCIRIPNDVLRHFLEWYYGKAVYNERLQEYIKTGKCDDTIFRIFMIQERSTDIALNLAPHIVEHVDWLVGGSTINEWRGYPARGAYFYDDDLVEQLEIELRDRR